MKFQKILGGLLTVMLAATLFAPANAQFIQQGPKLTGPVGFGWSGGISADGNTAIVSGSASRVYIRTNGVWTQQGNDLIGGNAVALSGDGNTVLVGFFDGATLTFKVRVFIRTNGVWNQQGPDLSRPSSDTYGQYGYSLGLSGDGNTAIVGSPISDGIGGAWIYIRKSGVWSSQGPELIGTGWENGGRQGYSVALSADGNTAIVGAPYDGPSIDEPTGAAWIFVRRNGVWTQQGKKLVGTPHDLVSLSGQKQGYSVALSADGSTALVGAPFYLTDSGGAFVFTHSTPTGEWRQQGPKLCDNDADGPAWQGASVTLSADGNTAVFGGLPYYSYNGAVVFTRRNGVWTQQSSKVVGTDAIGDAWQGSFVALSGDGNTLLIGGPNDNNGAGAAWVFTIPKAGPSPAWTRLSVPVGVPGGVSTNGADRDFEAVAYGTFSTNANEFVIGGLGGNIITYDGSKVFNRVVAPAGFEALAFSDNAIKRICVAVADKSWVYRSPDGVTWSEQQFNSNNFNGVAYAGNGVFVAVQAGGHIFRSTDNGHIFTESFNAGQPWTFHDLNGVAFGNGTLVVGASGTQVLYSTDTGVTWKVNDLSQISPPANLEGVAFGQGVGPNQGEFVAVADTGAVFASTDNGQTWSWTFVGPAAAAHPMQGVAYGAGSNQDYFVAVGKDGTTLIGPVDPLNGAISWYTTSFPTVYLRGVTFGMNRFVAVGYGATILQSKPLPW